MLRNWQNLLSQPGSARKCWSQHKESPLNAIVNEAEGIKNLKTVCLFVCLFDVWVVSVAVSVRSKHCGDTHYARHATAAKELSKVFVCKRNVRSGATQWLRRSVGRSVGRSVSGLTFSANVWLHWKASPRQVLSTATGLVRRAASLQVPKHGKFDERWRQRQFPTTAVKRCTVINVSVWKTTIYQFIVRIIGALAS